MAKRAASSSGKRRCQACGEEKFLREYPSSDAENCLACINKPPEEPPGSENAAEQPFEPIPRAEIDYSSPTAQELAARTLARRRLLHFIKRFKPKYQAGWVHEDICRRLERFKQQVAEGKSPRLLLMMPYRHGKQLADSTPMLTTKGWTTHGELRPGDEVFGPDGRPAKILAVSEKTPSDVMVTLSDGSVFFCHENHEWTVYQRSRQRWITVSARFWLEPSAKTGKRRALRSSGRLLYQLPKTAALEFPEATLPLDPYAFGAWLGDGSAGKACITHHGDDVEVIEGIKAAGYGVSAVCAQVSPTTFTTHFGSGVPNRRSAFSQGLKDTGALHDKHIPEIYKRASIAQRLQLLAGLIDTDGHVDKESQRVRIATVSDRLRDDIMELVRTLGFRPYVHTQQPARSTSGIQGRRPVHYVGFQPACAVPTRVPRKKITGAPQEAIGIVSVEKLPRAPEQGHCIQVDRPDGLYLAGRNLVPTHNSEISSRHFPPWVLGEHPDWEIIATSNAQSLATSFSRYIRDLMRDPSYHALFPEAKLDPSSQAVENWNTTAGGGYLAAGVGTAIIGRGAHILIIDDPVRDAEAADSQVIRDNTWEWYLSTAYSRLAPGGGVLGILTSWHDDDWAGRVIQAMQAGGDQFEVVRYPAINDQGDEYILPDDSIEQIPPGAPVPEGARMTRPMNTALHEARYTLEMLKKIKANYYALGQKRWWAAGYQQNPAPEDGAFFTKKMFRFFSTKPHKLERYCYQAWDFAITTKQTSDYTVGVNGEQDVKDNLYVTDVLRFKSDDGQEIADAMLDFWVAHGKEAVIGVEDGQIWRSIESTFKRRCQERSLYPSYEVLKPFTDKYVRAQPLRGWMQAGRVWFDESASWWEALRKELLSFGSGGRHDDQVDALAWLVRLVLGKSAPQPRKPKEMKSWKDKLRGLGKNKGVSHMAA